MQNQWAEVDRSDTRGLWAEERLCFLNMWFGELGSVDYRGEKLYEKAMGLRGKK